MTFTVDENTQLTLVQEVGVDVLEMDTVFTKDGVPVIWHDVGIIQNIF
jgi:glycerophosphoryl diester phosphodiesterase